MVSLIFNPFVFLSFNLKIVFGCYYVSLNQSYTCNVNAFEPWCIVVLDYFFFWCPIDLGDIKKEGVFQPKKPWHQFANKRFWKTIGHDLNTHLFNHCVLFTPLISSTSKLFLWFVDYFYTILWSCQLNPILGLKASKMCRKVLCCPCFQLYMNSHFFFILHVCR